MSHADKRFQRDEWLEGCPVKLYKIMNVEFNAGGANFIPATPASGEQTDSPSTSAKSSVSLSDHSPSWQANLKQASALRPEKVASAKVLANDSSYPSDADLNRLAGFLAGRL